jgi:hypothetical protein
MFNGSVLTNQKCDSMHYQVILNGVVVDPQVHSVLVYM